MSPTDRSPFWRDCRVFVTAGTGLVGRWLLRVLLERDADIIALVRDGVPESELIGGGLCYRWACVELSYYHGVGSGFMGFPIATRAVAPMLSVRMPLW